MNKADQPHAECISTKEKGKLIKHTCVDQYFPEPCEETNSQAYITLGVSRTQTLATPKHMSLNY